MSVPVGSAVRTMLVQTTQRALVRTADPTHCRLTLSPSVITETGLDIHRYICNDLFGTTPPNHFSTLDMQLLYVEPSAVRQRYELHSRPDNLALKLRRLVQQPGGFGWVACPRLGVGMLSTPFEPATSGI